MSETTAPAFLPNARLAAVQAARQAMHAHVYLPANGRPVVANLGFGDPQVRRSAG